MKKTYIQPATLALAVQPATLLAASPGAQDKEVTKGSVTDSDYDDYGEQSGEEKSFGDEW